ncbi:MAG: hypothetical protein WCT46_00155 [Candidatus Gracilibacteria bacterium]|jgi:hypothetical protein
METQKIRTAITLLLSFAVASCQAKVTDRPEPFYFYGADHPEKTGPCIEEGKTTMSQTPNSTDTNKERDANSTILHCIEMAFQGYECSTRDPNSIATIDDITCHQGTPPSRYIRVDSTDSNDAKICREAARISARTVIRRDPEAIAYYQEIDNRAQDAIYDTIFSSCMEHNTALTNCRDRSDDLPETQTTPATQPLSKNGIAIIELRPVDHSERLICDKKL